MKPGQMVETGLRRMKQVLETGDIMRSDAGIHAGMHPARPAGEGPGASLPAVAARIAAVPRQMRSAIDNWRDNQ